MNTKYVAIWDERLADYRWHFRQSDNQPREPLPPLPPGCVEIVYVASGNFVTREDGERAEILARKEGAK